MCKFQDLTGKKFGDWVVLNISDKRANKKIYWDCKCAICGRPACFPARRLTAGKNNNCGCFNEASSQKVCIEETGNTYGELTVLRRDGVDESSHATWLVRCSCGEEFVTLGKNLRGKNKITCCVKCSYKLRAIGNMKDISGKRFGKLLVIDRLNIPGKSIWNCECECGKVVRRSRTSLISGTCTSCGCDVKKRTKDMLDITGKRFGRLIAEEFLDGRTRNECRWLCRCDCGNHCVVKLSSLLSGRQSCGCMKSKAEMISNRILTENNIIFTPQKTFEDCKDKGLLQFDIYIDNINMCIELDGIQHFKPVKRFFGEEGLKITQKHDSIKNKYCEDNHINLLRIPYTQFNNIEQILIENNVIKGEPNART